MLHGVSRFLLCELFSVLAGELLLDGCWAHMHSLLVFFGFGKGIGVVIKLGGSLRRIERLAERIALRSRLIAVRGYLP